ncbi:ankyrin repeat and SOCS box protein 17-like [Osmerus mordax]|uniref:ankyrin repeat and SOCS box protein 17-like n=1 Tax=Osmerus mordax TaxID=8014 RepID=UPI003510A524
MSDSEDDNHHDCNVFLNLVARVIRKPLYRFPGQWGQETYEPRIYKTLGTILRNATSEEFDSFIVDFINFAKTAHARLEPEFYMEFINVCTNTILHWVFARRGSAEIVRKLMERTSPYLQDQTNNLAIAWRRFTPIYSPSTVGGVTPLMFVAQNRQYDVLKVLLQYGMLERERRPTYVIISILFNPPRLEVLDERCLTTVTTELEDCMELCFRVVTYVCMADIEMQVVYGRKALIEDWKKHIPLTRYQEPCELSHLCRVAVRACLLQRGRLPDGIRALPLPAPLRNYLNLDN